MKYDGGKKNKEDLSMKNEALGALGNTTDLSPTEDLPSLMVFKKSKRLAWFFTILVSLYVADIFLSGFGDFKWVNGELVEGGEHIFAFFLLWAALVLGLKRHKMVFEIPTQTIREETGFWPSAIKKKSISFETIKSIDLIEEIRSSLYRWSYYNEGKISCFVIKIIFQDQVEVGLNLFRDPAKGREYLNYIAKKLNVASNDRLTEPSKEDPSSGFGFGLGLESLINDD